MTAYEQMITAIGAYGYSDPRTQAAIAECGHHPEDGQ